MLQVHVSAVSFEVRPTYQFEKHLAAVAKEQETRTYVRCSASWANEVMLSLPDNAVPHLISVNREVRAETGEGGQMWKVAPTVRLNFNVNVHDVIALRLALKTS